MKSTGTYFQSTVMAHTGEAIIRHSENKNVI